MADICIIGRHGFLGSALAKRFTEVDSFPTRDTKILFHFGSPVHPPFEQNPDYHLNEIIQSFLYLLPFCRDNDIYFVYPSSALVYEKDTVFTKTKKMMELMASMYPKTLGLRLFPVYGPREQRTVISQWTRQVNEGKRPVVYGNGEQERDFIYIDDAIDQILFLAKKELTGVHDVGAGEPVSFNEVLRVISLMTKKPVLPFYQDAPKDYSKGIVCQHPGKVQVSLYEGIKKILG